MEPAAYEICTVGTSRRSTGVSCFGVVIITLAGFPLWPGTHSVAAGGSRLSPSVPVVSVAVGPATDPTSCQRCPIWQLIPDCWSASSSSRRVGSGYYVCLGGPSSPSQSLRFSNALQNPSSAESVLVDPSSLGG
ncbi:uncharacterized protein BO80DRAFT_250272 [Aspergillus ibericus CBS 121593]|uniref:Uncharacterized protein n=1 Tax=Aspergillus ibericus CBS 121593 TaxID=1448316 RepID=A0A395GJR4_9EURO|nr:hypothetical protein BO80DRAFT_250272 [Aspergillus ibericus CBS 121593]RAK95735.1 hypothetical protein BO80DRAFT_250272 [Aspergillus ibericus CBS 121593]